MGKYIIELERGETAYKTVDSNGTPLIQLLTPIPYTEPDLEQVKEEAYEKGYHAGYSKYLNKSYEDGLKDAWEAARKIENLPEAEKFEIFGEYDMFHIMRRYTATEAIEKIRQYEQKKDRQARIEYNCEEIKDVINTTMRECNVSLDEIAAVLQKMRGTE